MLATLSDQQVSRHPVTEEGGRTKTQAAAGGEITTGPLDTRLRHGHQ